MTALQKFQCFRCDGAVAFDRFSTKIKCPYCDTEFDVESIKSYLEVTQSPQQDDMTWEKSGARKQKREELTDQLVGQLRPDLVIPFKLDNKTAKKALKKYFTGKKLLPKIFIDENQLDQIKGVYVPIWLFHADAQGYMTYKATRVRKWSDSKRDYTETVHYHVVRAGTLDFPGISVVGSSKLNDRLIAALEPFDVQQALDFRTDYLADSVVNQCDVSFEDCLNRVNARIKAAMTEAFRNTVSGYTSVNQQASAVQLQNSRAQYVLCPVWLLTTTWQGQEYIFAINGQTGKMAGDLPVDQKAFWRWFGSLFGIVTAACFIITWLLWMI